MSQHGGGWIKAGVIAISITPFIVFGTLVGIVLVSANAVSCGIADATSTLNMGISAGLKLGLGQSIASSPEVTGGAAAKYFSQFTATERSEREKNAGLIVQIGQARGFSQHSIAIAVATAIQESNLKNIVYQGKNNNYDSLGLFQQRPSQGWGTPSQIMDPNYAINKFYDRLATIPDRDSPSRSMIDVAMQIQIPNKAAYHSRWQWDGIANDIVNQLAPGTPERSADASPVYAGGGSSNSCLSVAPTGSVVTFGWHLPLDPGYWVSDVFGMRYHPVYHRMIMHAGYDLADPLGAKIYAVNDGTVEKASPSGDYGNFILIDHGGGVESAYGHLSAYAISAGDHVKAGQVIGYVGKTGDATGPHLHFEIRVNKKAVDPAKYLQGQGIQLVPKK